VNRAIAAADACSTTRATRAPAFASEAATGRSSGPDPATTAVRPEKSAPDFQSACAPSRERQEELARSGREDDPAGRHLEAPLPRLGVEAERGVADARGVEDRGPEADVRTRPREPLEPRQGRGRRRRSGAVAVNLPARTEGVVEDDRARTALGRRAGGGDARRSGADDRDVGIDTA
jgi:hypothetical protein